MSQRKTAGLPPVASLAKRREREYQGIGVLVVDPDPRVREWFEAELGDAVALLESAADADEAQALCDRYRFDVIVVERDLPEGSGIDWARRLDVGEPTPRLIVTSAVAELDTAVECLRSGASDFFLKPLQGEELLGAVRRCARRDRQPPAARGHGSQHVRDRHTRLRQELMGGSAQMAEVCALIERVAPLPVTVLIEGESGTGKELAAHSVHRLSGCRGRFVPVNCGSISPELLESELFGHAKGAFTGAHQQREGLFSSADHGTLFLDEIGEMPLPMQAKLLRVLDEHRVRPVGADRHVAVDVRVIAATNRSLVEQVRAGAFREDLFFRLNVISLRMPPLRERREDIVELVRHYAERLAPEFGQPAPAFSADELRALETYAWPGNVRELINLVERSLLLGRLPLDYFDENAPPDTVAGHRSGADGYPLDWSLRDVTRAHALRVLAAHDGNKSRAARCLGISRKTLDRNLKAWRAAGEPDPAGDGARH